MSSGKILVIRGGAIGDFILTLPVLTALREQFPNAGLELLGYPHVAALAEAGGLVDSIRSIEARPLAGFFAKNGTLDASLRDYFAGFAIIISYLYDPDRIFEENVRRCASKAQFIVGPHKPDERINLHATEALLKPLERLAIFAPDPVPKLTLESRLQPVERTALVSAEAGISNAGPGGRQAIAIHPGSGSERKNWPEAKWAETLALLLENSNRKILLVGGEAEGDRLARLAQRRSSEQIEILQSKPLVEVARRLSSCAAFIGHDSGISHLAAAVGVPTIALWGESNEVVWRPKGERVVVLKSDAGLHSISPAAIIAALP